MRRLILPKLLRSGRLIAFIRRFSNASYIRGPREPRLLESTVGDHLSYVTSAFGDRNAVISKHQRTSLTYEALHEKSNALARGFSRLGIRKGDRVAVSLGNNIEYALTTYALFKLGAILAPLNPAFNVQQIVSAITHLEASILVIGAETNLPRKASRSNIKLFNEICTDINGRVFHSVAAPSIQRVVLVDNSEGRVKCDDLTAFNKFTDVLEDGESRGIDLAQDLHPNEVINIQFTSGTTSSPKAACLTHHSILNNGYSIGERLILTDKDVVCCPPPLFHCFGSILGFMATATHGSCIVFPSEAFNPLATLKAVQEERATALYGVPTMFLAGLELLQNGEVSHCGFERLRTGIAAGSNIPSELMKKLHNVLNLKELTICYGMTETSPVSAMTTTDDPLDKRINTVGRLLPHVDAKVVSPTNPTEILPLNVRGELAVSGYLLMKEYWKDPERTQQVMQADEAGKVWMHTGDEALIDDDGYVRITGRLKDIIIRGGENIQPSEIEDVLLAHEHVAEAFVVGVPDDRYGEVVAAFIVPRAGSAIVDSTHNTAGPNAKNEKFENMFRDWIRIRLSDHLVPKYVFRIASGDVPKTASGKIQKFLLREEAINLVAST